MSGSVAFSGAGRMGASPLATRRLSISSVIGSGSVSTTLRSDFVRSWLFSRRTVSVFASTAFDPPVTNPTTSTRWKAVTSIFAWIGVSIWTSEMLRQAAADTARRPLATAAAILPVIDFTEGIVVLPDVFVGGFDLERGVVGLAGLGEQAHLFIADREVIPRFCVRLVELDGLLPPENGFSPETLVRHVDAERDLGLRVRMPVGIDRHRERQQERHEKCA